MGLTEDKEMSASIARSGKRAALAAQIASERYERDDDVETFAAVEYVDGGYWVDARVFVDFETVEDRMPKEGHEDDRAPTEGGVMYQEEAEQLEYDREIRAQEDYRRREGTGMVDLKRDDWAPEDEHGNALPEQE